MIEHGVCEEFLYDIKGGLRPPTACGRRFAPSSAIAEHCAGVWWTQTPYVRAANEPTGSDSRRRESLCHLGSTGSGHQ